MARRQPRQHTVKFKLAVLAPMDTAPDLQALARELDIKRARLYRWQRAYVRGGASGLRSRGRPRAVLNLPLAAQRSAVAEPSAPRPARPAAPDPGAAGRITELERRGGQQQLELDFFAQPCGMSGRYGGRAAGLAGMASTR